MKQEAIIVRGSHGTKDLNARLAEGWIVLHTCPMPSSHGGEHHGSWGGGGFISATCLVVIGKPDA